VVFTWFPSLPFYRLTEEERRKKLKEERKERALEEKRRKVEEKLKERAKLKEEKLRLAEFLKMWNRQREDLECEDLKVCCIHARAGFFYIDSFEFGHVLLIPKSITISNLNFIICSLGLYVSW
jgi:hypothetical protein